MSQAVFDFSLKYFNLKPWTKVLGHMPIPFSHPINKIGSTYIQNFFPRFDFV